MTSYLFVAFILLAVVDFVLYHFEVQRRGPLGNHWFGSGFYECWKGNRPLK